MRILVLCSGNICRSPLAAALLEARLRACGLDSIEVASAGTLGIEGEPAHPASILAAARAGASLEDHLSSALTPETLGASALVLGMERHHLDRARAIDPAHRPRKLLGTFMPEDDRAAGEEIPDPLGGDPEDFRRCFASIEAAVDGLVEAIRSGSLVLEEPAEAGDEGERRYFERVGEAIARARGGPAALSSMEFHVVDAWWRRGVPLWLVLEAIEAVASQWPAGEAPRGFHRLCEPEVERRLKEAGLDPDATRC